VYILETPRLALRRLAPEDAADLYRIYGDPETMKFTGRAPASVEEERANILSHIAKHYDVHGVGLWPTVLKGQGEVIGRCGLMRKRIGGAEEVEIAYLLGREWWGRGLATEAAQAILRLGFESYKFRRIVAVIDPANVASIRVAKKIGMNYEKEVTYGDYGKVALYAWDV
jgi:[ribosomal protein S5]-alanine N-acetyltransferase